VPSLLDPEIRQSLVDRFASAVMSLADLPPSRLADLTGAAQFSATKSEIRCTCGVTGSTYAEPWDGSPVAAEQFAGDAAENTAYPIRTTPHYAWLRASK
jgi:hypothetical protein